MFDQNPTTPNQPPQNLPTGQFMPTSQPAVPTKIPLAEPEDILAATDQAEANIKLANQVPTSWQPAVPPAMTPPAKPVSKEPFFSQYKKVMVIILILIVILGTLAAAGWYGYNTFFGQTGLPNTKTTQPAANLNAGNLNINQPTVNQNSNLADTNQTPGTNEPLNTNANVNQAVATPEQPLDSDRDGLTDTEEKMYGTNPNDVDTDKDGLTDRDEVKVFKTDPNNADTDGDGYTDGVEVNNGYDPKGPGKLLKIE